MNVQFVYPLESINREHSIGAKAEHIRWLADHQYRIPKTFILPFEAEAEFRKDRQKFESQLIGELTAILNPETHYAVRSSANVEDRAEHSFAGQFTSKLNIQGTTAVAQAVFTLYDHLSSAPPEAYLNRIGARGTPLQMAVILQEMVTAGVSGVSFSKNPVTGLDEVIVEAIEGSGEDLLQGGKNPDRWVAKWGGWTEEPESTTIDSRLIQRVVEQTKAAAAAFGAPVDLEWVYGDEALYWVQVRRITTSEDIHIYSNRIAREVLPGLIKPLVWSINTPLVNRAWIDLFTELIGPNDIRPEDLARSIYYRAYFNMGVIGRIFELLGFPPETLELLLGLEGGKDRPTFKPTRKTFRHLPRMLRFVVDKIRFNKVADQKLPHLKAEFDRFKAQDFNSLHPEGLLKEIETLRALTQEAAYLNIVIPLLMSIYSAVLKRQLAGLDVDYAQFDLAHGLDELADYEPNVHLATLNHKYQNLSVPSRERVLASPSDSWRTDPELSEFHHAFTGFLELFGHLSESGNDFSSRPWREDPALVLKLIANYASAQGKGETVRYEDLRPAAFQKLPIQMAFKQARRYRYYREAISSVYTHGYGLFRQLFLSLGLYLTDEGWIAEQEDIFFLTYEEVKGVVRQDGDQKTIMGTISRRKEELGAAEDILLPELIYGDEPPPPKMKGDPPPRLTGIPSSRGYYRGPVTVIKRVQDFDQLTAGDVLVIPFSDVAWTPLFGKAGAVIAESGGLLSHSSIVAREFNIPCVVSVRGACQLPDKAEVGVDGFSGEITIISDSE
jgi:pyruvate,water dikinase